MNIDHEAERLGLRVLSRESYDAILDENRRFRKTMNIVRKICDGEGSYAMYSDAGKLFTIATIVGSENGWDGL